MNTDFSKGLALAAGLFFSLSLTACATYQNKVQESRQALVSHDFSKALKDLEPLAANENGDQLVYLLDYATALQISGNYKDSNNAFLKADRLSELVDYQSISRQTGSLLLNQEMVQYKGDTFEKIFINAYLAMNFLELGNLDDALVEARRINEKFIKNRQEEKKSFEMNSFSKYLSAVIWEANKNYDDAYIAYTEAYKIDPTIGPIGEDLIRSAKLARRNDAYQSWKKKFPDVKEEKTWYDKNIGELVVIFQQGWGPRKVPSSNEYRLPALMPVRSETVLTRLSFEGGGNYVSRLIYDVEMAAIQTLKDDYGILVAKRMAGFAAKAVAADQVRQQDRLLGDLTYIALNLADRADLRQWSFLPQSIQMIRIPLAPGKYKFNLEGLTLAGVPTGEGLKDQEVEIQAGKKKFVVWRSLK
ncbi:COG3014 family protein [Bdellovibrio svalbardensis]|uniref:Lipoprotein n=1 Tax=Bdellovibrio svalbardensis TaxID=2972972 RepID=A0ABT6DFM4_9BACT|nr:hypothetical protein [Bdellovibrio svalbardensis]MDG0814744.1 hypothetical protein [Bdellovibrio svalbardensis]